MRVRKEGGTRKEKINIKDAALIYYKKTPYLRDKHTRE